MSRALRTGPKPLLSLTKALRTDPKLLSRLSKTLLPYVST